MPEEAGDRRVRPTSCDPTFLVLSNGLLSRSEHGMALRRSWGHALVLLHRSRHLAGIDLLIVLGLAGLVWGWFDVARQWTYQLPAIEINFNDPGVLPHY